MHASAVQCRSRSRTIGTVAVRLDAVQSFDEFNDPLTKAPMVRLYQARIPEPITGSVGEPVTAEADGRTFRGVIKEIDETAVVLLQELAVADEIRERRAPDKLHDHGYVTVIFDLNATPSPAWVNFFDRTPQVSNMPSQGLNDFGRPTVNGREICWPLPKHLKTEARIPVQECINFANAQTVGGG
jgi:hypothetical protein